MPYARRFHAYCILAGLSLFSAGLAPQADAAASQIEPTDSYKVMWALIWTADFDRLIDTTAPEYMPRAIRSFQHSQQFFETGALIPVQKRLLFTIAQQISEDVGARLFTDPRAGVRLFVPGNYISRVVATPFGTLFSGSVRGTLELVTFKFPGGEGALEALHAALRNTVGGRTAITRFDNRLQNNRMILVRIHKPLRTYVYAVPTPDGIKGFRMTWSIENTELLHRVATAAANSFTPLVRAPLPAPRAENRGPKALQAREDAIVGDLANTSLIEVLARPRLGE